MTSKDGSILKIRNLWEPKQQSIRHHLSKSYITLAAGQEIVLTESNRLATAPYYTDSIGRRNIRRSDVDNDRQIITAEISLVTLIANSPLLKMLASSKESENNIITDKILKMAACLHQVDNTARQSGHLVSMNNN